MALRWFRQNKTFTRWFYIVVTVFVMITFSITGAMIDGCHHKGDGLTARFELPSGRTVDVPQFRIGLTSRVLSAFQRGATVEEQDVLSYIMSDELARDVGIRVGDEAVAKSLRMFGITDKQSLNEVARNVRVSPTEMTEFIRSDIRIQLLRSLTQPPVEPGSQEIYEQFRAANEMLSLSYVRFDDAAHEAEVDPAAVSEEDLRAFLETELPEHRRRSEFSTPETLRLDMALLDASAADAEALRARLPEDRRSVAETDLRQAYQRDLASYMVEVPREDDAKKDAVDGEEGTEAEDADEDADAEGDDAKDEATVERVPRPFEEVRAEIERDVLAARVLAAAALEYEALEKDRKDREAKVAEEAPATGEDTAPGSEGTAEAEVAEKDPLVQVAEEFGLEHVVVEEPKSIDQLETLPRIGSAGLAMFVPGMQAGAIHQRPPTAAQRTGFLLRVREKIPPQVRPLDEIEQDLRVAWQEETLRKKAREDAQAFRDAVEAKARELAGDEVAKLEQEARDRARATAAEKGITDAAEIAKLEEDEIARIQSVVDEVVSAREGETLEAVAQERGAAVVAVPEFRRTYQTTEFYRDDPDSPEKFLYGHGSLLAAAEGSVVGPLRADAVDTFLVVEVTDRRFPDPDEMRLIDRMMARGELMRQRRDAAGMQPSPLSFEVLARSMNLQVQRPKPPPAAAP